MKVLRRKVTIREVVEGYVDDGDGGVRGYGRRLDIRPPYQREFVYEGRPQEAVIDTVLMGAPLSSMYWSVVEGGWELLDGQQRTISTAHYALGEFAVKGHSFGGLSKDEQEAFLDYELMVFECDGSDKEKLDWFQRICHSGERHNRQEIRNAVYRGTFLDDAKRWFSRPGMGAAIIGKPYMAGAVNRQDYLAEALKWASCGDVVTYMDVHRRDVNADHLRTRFDRVIGWVKATFPTLRREMKGVDWGRLFREHGDRDLDPVELEARIHALMENPDVRRKKGVYEYVLTGQENLLDGRTFSESDRRTMYEQQGGICPITGKRWDIEEMEADHIIPFVEGGRTILSNGRMISKEENRRKGAR